MKINSLLKSSKGFTLIEVLISTAIVISTMIIVTSFQAKVFTNTQYSQDVLSSGQDAREILRVMVKELRSTKPGNNGSYPIAQAATNTLTFYSDIDSDGLQEQVRYFIATTTLKKGVIKPTGSPLSYVPTQEILTTLAYNIKNSTSTPMFEYFDNTYAGTSSPLVQPVVTTAVRLVRVNLVIDADPNRSPLPRTYTSDATLRNLKDNL